jgi:peptide deformylase
MSPILVYPNDILRQPSMAIPDFNLRSAAERERVDSAIKDAREAMIAANGVGISGIQIGAPLRFFWMGDEKGGLECAINPSYEIVEGDSPRFVREGCLSFPGIFGNVKRYQRILATYERCFSDSNSSVKRWGVELTGLKAHVFQHEMEHLDGGLFIDKMFPSEAEKITRKLRKPGYCGT